MANTKISALSAGSPAQSGDEIPINRSGTNYKLTAAEIVALVTPTSLGLVIGTDVQAFDATILTESDVDDTPVDSATTAPVSSNWAYDHQNLTQAHGISSFGATLVDDTDAATARTTLGVVIGTDVSRAVPLVDEETGTSYTLDISDSDSVKQFTNASTITVTVPPNSSVAFPIGTFIEIWQGGAGTVTLVEGSGVTIKSKGDLVNLSGQEAAAGIRKVATDIWRLTGDLA